MNIYMVKFIVGGKPLAQKVNANSRQEAEQKVLQDIEFVEVKNLAISEPEPDLCEMMGLESP